VYIHHPPAGVPEGKLPVLYAHGIQSHPGWFTGSAMALSEAGHTVYQVTRRGSGDNDIARGDCRSRHQLLDDVTLAIEFLRDAQHADRFALLGVSWGGKLLAAFLARDNAPADVASLTLVAPGVVPRADVQFRVKIRIAGSLVVHPDMLYDIPLSSPALFTDNEAMREYLADDAHRLHQATARFLFESRLMDRDVRRAKAGSITCPTTLILSERDKIIDNEKTRAVIGKLVGVNLNVIVLPGAHTLEFEPDPAEFYRRVVEAVQRGE
jgi:alpha-beta hydrolase superfamily lysophospholipase